MRMIIEFLRSTCGGIGIGIGIDAKRRDNGTSGGGEPPASGIGAMIIGTDFEVG